MNFNHNKKSIDSKFSDVLEHLNHNKDIDYATVTYGWHRKSLGVKSQRKNNIYEWIRISNHPSLEEAETRTKRLLDCNMFVDVKKPTIYEASTFQYNGEFWTYVIMSYHCIKNISDTPELKASIPVINPQVLFDIKTQLKNIECTPVPYTSVRQELITRRIQERHSSGINTTIENWTTIHGDLHWANISSDAFIFDWESYGIGPKGIDIAFLYLFSLMNKKVKKLIENVFSDFFSLRQFKLCLLFGISELMRMTEKYQDHPELYTHLEALGIKTHQDLLNES